jgi:hypothetical protein
MPASSRPHAPPPDQGTLARRRSWSTPPATPTMSPTAAATQPGGRSGPPAGGSRLRREIVVKCSFIPRSADFVIPEIISISGFR